LTDSEATLITVSYHVPKVYTIIMVESKIISLAYSIKHYWQSFQATNTNSCNC